MRYFLEIAFSGKPYNGWQVQENAPSVQALVDDAVSKVLRSPIQVYGQGRTDTGVHAKQFFAHFNAENIPDNFLYTVNKILPNSINIYHCVQVHQEAHARFSCYERTYQYFINKYKNPFNVDFEWQYDRDLDLVAMQKAAILLKGTHDYSSFFSRANAKVNPVCIVSKLELTTITEAELVITITANRFLRNMVRTIVGTLVEVGLGKKEINQIPAIIAAKDRKAAGFTAPAEGLFLTSQSYPDWVWNPNAEANHFKLNRP